MLDFLHSVLMALDMAKKIKVIYVRSDLSVGKRTWMIQFPVGGAVWILTLEANDLNN